MATLNKTTTEIEDVLLNWVYADVVDWHTDLISALAQQYINSCYEAALKALEDSGELTIPVAKVDVIMLAQAKGVLKSAAERQAEAEAEMATTEAPI